MGDRRASFPFRIWTSTRTSTNRRQSTPPIVSASSPRTSEISTTLQPATELSTPTATTADAENREPDLPPTTIKPTPQDSSELKQPIQPNLKETSASSEAEPQNLASSGVVTQSLSQSLSPSPSRQPVQSKSTAQPSSPSSTSPPTLPIPGTQKTRSPPQSSSPNRTSPRTRSSPSLVVSKTPSSPPGVSKPRSPSHTRSPHHKSSPFPKGPTSPSKESAFTREISNSTGAALVFNEEEPNLSASRQETVEPPPNTETKADNVANSEGLSANDLSNEDKEMNATPSKLSELDSGSIPAECPESAAPIHETGSSNVDDHNSGDKSNSKPEGMKEVEAEQVSKAESIQEASKGLETYSNPEASFETQQIKPNNKGSDSEEMHKEKKETFTEKESLVSSSPNNKPTNTSSQPLIQGVAIDNNKQSSPLRGENAHSSKGIRENISTFVSRMAIGNPESSIHDKPVNVITLAGENRGASMHLGLDSLKEGSIHIHRSYKINPNESAADTITTDGDGSRKEADTSNAKTLDDKPTEAYVNNNAQSINNSLVFNCSIVERNPGVHMLLISQVPKVPANAEQKAKPIETRRAELSMTSAKKLMYKPKIRRRCLRGLFLEPSDSDNPEKPRRHGCRVGCKERGKDEKIHVFSS